MMVVTVSIVLNESRQKIIRNEVYDTMIKRVIAALMAATVIFISTYNTYTVSVNALETVVVGDTLLELLAAFLATLGISYCGSTLTDEFSQSDYEDMVRNFCINHIAWSSRYAAELAKAGYIVKEATDLSLDSPEEVDVLLSMPCAGILVNDTLIDLATSDEFFIKDASGKEFSYSDHVDDVVDQDIFFVNPLLPENVYIGYNSNVVPGIAAMTGYDASLSHVQFYNTIYFGGYAVGQIDYSEYNGGGSMYYNALRVDHYVDQSEVRSRTQYVIGQNGKLSLFGYSNPAYIFTSAGSDLCNDGYYYNHCIVDAAHPLYLSPSATQPVIYVEGNTNYKYLVYQSGVVWDGNVSTSPSKVVTDTGALLSAKSIVNKSYADYVATLMDAMVNVDDAVAKPLALSPDAIQNISNVLNEYYSTAVTNYYDDTTYVDGNTYIQNITNIYEQAAVDTPAINPAIPVTPVLGNIGDYKVTGLSDVFPFCIPFDMYDLLTILAADPKAISFDYTFYFGEYLGEYTINVDLSVFDPVMQVVRTMELLVYIFGLMLVTRNLIRG